MASIAFGEGNGTPLQSSCMENTMDGGAWWAAVHGVAKSQTRLSNFPFTFHFHALEKEMATHSSVLAWRIPGMGEPGGLPSMGSHRVGHDWSDLSSSSSIAFVSSFVLKHVSSVCLFFFFFNFIAQAPAIASGASSRQGQAVLGYPLPTAARPRLSQRPEAHVPQPSSRAAEN